VAAAVSGKYGCKRSGQGDFVKLSLARISAGEAWPCALMFFPPKGSR
jgi:hypothetical protein